MITIAAPESFSRSEFDDHPFGSRFCCVEFVLSVTKDYDEPRTKRVLVVFRPEFPTSVTYRRYIRLVHSGLFIFHIDFIYVFYYFCMDCSLSNEIIIYEIIYLNRSERVPSSNDTFINRRN